MNKPTQCPCGQPADPISGGDRCRVCLDAEVEADFREHESKPHPYPSFTCPICRGSATLVDGETGPEFCCLDCPIAVTVADRPTGKAVA